LNVGSDVGLAGWGIRGRSKTRWNESNFAKHYLFVPGNYLFG